MTHFYALLGKGHSGHSSACAGIKGGGGDAVSGLQNVIILNCFPLQNDADHQLGERDTLTEPTLYKNYTNQCV